MYTPRLLSTHEPKAALLLIFFPLYKLLHISDAWQRWILSLCEGLVLILILFVSILAQICVPRLSVFI